MTRTPFALLPSLALAAILTAAPLLAQDTTADAPADDAPAATAEDGSDDLGLNMGTPAGEAEEERLGTTYVQGVSGDWEIHCVRTQLEADPCALHQLLRDETDNAVATIELVNLPQGQSAAAGATIVTPLETLLTEQLTLSIDGGGGRRYPFNFCTPRGCVSRVGFTAEDVSRFKRGNEGQLSIVPMVAPDQRVNLKVSLTGFTDGFGQITELNEANAAAIAKAQAAAQAEGSDGN